ncbi:NUDIX hydrolase [Propionibacterium sp.]|uniref:NUDIX hydrolase n=1 Tax=Propionibacterium sp. TaxID=1977903 RepID=UPI0039E97066
MSSKPDVRAAGAIVFRGAGNGRRVLLEHRPGYDDWTLPKGKPHHHEYLPVTAVREVEEETGVHLRLGRPLPCLDYEVGSGSKRVWWWLGEQVGPTNPVHDDECDELAWPTLSLAHQMLSYPDERELLTQAAETAERPTGGTLILVRHAKAKARKNWRKDDRLRTLATRGRHQAKALIGLFEAYGINTIVSSTSTRCVHTVQPAAEQLGIEPELVPLLSEEGAKGHDAEVSALMGQLRARAVADPVKSLVVCGHRPVLPTMQRGLGLEVESMSPAQCQVLHLDAEGLPAQVETYPSEI